MYPEPPEYTPKQDKTIRKWLNIAGSKGKGCGSAPIWTDMGENRPIRYTLTHNGRRIVDDAINNAESLPGVKGTIHHTVGASENQRSGNK